MTPHRLPCLVVLCVTLLAMALVPKGEIRRVPFGVVPTTGLFKPDLSDNGRWVVVQSRATNLTETPGDSDIDIYLVDLKKGVVSQVSLTHDGLDPDRDCLEAAVSATGRYVTYRSNDGGIVEGVSDAQVDVYLRDTKKGTNDVISVNDQGVSGNGTSSVSAVSKNGRWVAFESVASNLVDDDDNGDRDIFLRDRKAGTTVLLSRDAEGEPGDGDSDAPAMSANGRFVAFASFAALVPEDTNGHQDVYLVDVKKGTTTLVSVGDQGQLGDADSGGFLDVSANGRYVSFTSGAQNLLTGVDPAFANVFRRDVKKGLTELVSSASDGTPAASLSTTHEMSSDGRFIAFQSFSNDFGPPDVNATDDVYLKDVKQGTVERISVGFGGAETDDSATFCSISKKGKWVVFESLATNLEETPDAHPGTDVFVKRR